MDSVRQAGTGEASVPSGGPVAPEPPAQFRVVDRRLFANLDDIPAGGPIEDKPRYPRFVEELQARVAETERRYDEKRRQVDEELARLRARLEADFTRRIDLGKTEVLAPLLEVLDNLERTLTSAAAGAGAESLIAGVTMTADLFRTRLKGMGVEPIEALDRPFDPNTCQAVGTVHVGDPSHDGIVVEELLRGYSLGGRLLRAAQVRVGKLD